MSTLGSAGGQNFKSVQIAGILAVGGGIAGLIVHPALYKLGDTTLFHSLIVPVWITSALGAFTLVWGIYAVSTHQWRPLTPPRALIIPILITLSWIMAAYQPAPNIDLLGAPWTPPTLTELFRYLSTSPPGAFIGGSVLTAVGVAVARSQWRWAAGAIGLAAVVSLNMGRFSGSYVGAVVLVTAVGVIPTVIGYITANRKLRS